MLLLLLLLTIPRCRPSTPGEAPSRAGASAKAAQFLRRGGAGVETEEEVLALLRDARAAGCDILTIGQYLQPTKRHLPVVEFVHPDRFKAFEAAAYALGFASVFSGPLVRSSYHAEVVAGAVRMVG